MDRPCRVREVADPGCRDSVDLGPLAGTLMLALFIRLAFLGRRARAASAPAAGASLAGEK